MLIAASAFILGILSAFYWSAPGLLLCLLFLVFGIALFNRHGSLKYIALLCLALGFWRGDVYLQDYYSRLVPTGLEGKDIRLQAKITEIPVKLHKGWRLVVAVQESQPKTKMQSLQLNWYSDAVSPTLGETGDFTVRLKRPHGYANPAGFNYEQWMLSRNLHGRGYIRNADRLHRPASTGVRQSLWDSLQGYPGDAGSLIAALVLGEKHGLSHSQRQLFIDSGTAHLFAISGLHISMVAGLFFISAKLIILLILSLPVVPGIVRHCIYRLTPLRTALACSWLGCLSYSLLAGLSLSTQRALIMLSVVYLACALRQRIFSLHSFSLALLLIVLSQPAAVLGPGLFLSFSAVAWIAYILHMLPAQLANWKKVLLIQLLLPLCLWPIVQFYFGSAATLGAIANIILIPLMSFVLLPLCLLAVALEAFFPLSNTGLIGLIDTLYQYILAFLQQLNATTWAKPIIWKIGIEQLLLLQLCIALLLLPRGSPKTLKALALAAAVFGLVPDKPNINKGEFVASVIDVGQGLSVLLQTQSHNLLYDTGPAYPSGFSVSKAVIVPFLQSQNIQYLDLLMLSHGDQDHQGGLAELLGEVKAGRVVSGQPERIKLPVKEVELCHSGQSWHWDGVKFEVLWPEQSMHTNPSGLWTSANNHSCVLRVSSAAQTLLLSGDIEKAVEDKLLNNNAVLQADILVAPHHGSNSSSSSAFIQVVDPRLAIFSAAYRSRFGHPHKKVLKRYKDAGVKWLNTATCGQFIYTKPTTTCHRNLNKLRWQSKKAQ